MSAPVWCALGVFGLLASLCGCQLLPSRSAGLSALRRDPQAAQRLNEQGLELVEQQHWPEAEARFREALRQDPYLGPAHCNLGVVLLQQRKFYEAGWELRYACQLMPRVAAPRTNLGILYEAVGRYGPAEEQLQQALALAPEDVEIIGHLARVHVRQGKRTDQTLAWLQTITTEDDDPAWRNWARAQLVRTTSTESSNGE